VRANVFFRPLRLLRMLSELTGIPEKSKTIPNPASSAGRRKPLPTAEKVDVPRIKPVANKAFTYAGQDRRLIFLRFVQTIYIYINSLSQPSRKKGYCFFKEKARNIRCSVAWISQARLGAIFALNSWCSLQSHSVSLKL
jgi:hypothetical protein